MKVYDVGNKAREGFWCAAPDEEAAKQIALAAGHAKKIENLHVTDITEKFEGIGAAEILSGTRTGHLCWQGASHNAAEFFKTIKDTGKPPVPKPGKWIFVGEKI